MCNQCFQEYCWDGTIAQGPLSDYDPTYKVPDEQVSVTGGAGRLGAYGAVVVGLVVGIVNLI